MTHYILVHGAWEGAWTWDETAPFLEKAGHIITAVDLPGSRGNPLDIAKITIKSGPIGPIANLSNVRIFPSVI